MNKVVVGLSGGVDSSVAAASLQHQGYDVIGLTLWLMKGKGQCCSEGMVLLTVTGDLSPLLLNLKRPLTPNTCNLKVLFEPIFLASKLIVCKPLKTDSL